MSDIKKETKDVVIKTSIREGSKVRNDISALGGMFSIMALTKEMPDANQMKRMKILLARIDKRDQKVWSATLDQLMPHAKWRKTKKQ